MEARRAWGLAVASVVGLGCIGGAGPGPVGDSEVEDSALLEDGALREDGAPHEDGSADVERDTPADGPGRPDGGVAPVDAGPPEAGPAEDAAARVDARTDAEPDASADAGTDAEADAAPPPDCELATGVAYRTLELTYAAPDGALTSLDLAAWYPTLAEEAPFEYGDTGKRGRVAAGAVAAPCGPYPVIVFSHGLGGCGVQSVFLTETLARHGYMVLAPDHADHLACSIDGLGGGGGGPGGPDAGDPETWDDTSYADRRDDVRAILDWVAVEASRPASPLEGALDPTRVGLVGHSLGGYTSMGLAGGWSTWQDARIDVVVGLSPYSQPYQLSGDVPAIGVPIMYQGGTLDLGITPALKGTPQYPGAYNLTTAPRVFAELPEAGHMAWSNTLCDEHPEIADCLAHVPNASTINRYAFAFLDKYLYDDATADLVLLPEVPPTDTGELATCWVDL